MELTLTTEEYTELYSLLRFHLENLDKDDDRYEPTHSLLEKLN